MLSVHQGPGLTNALTGIAEAAKSRTPLVVLAPEATNPASNFYLDLPRWRPRSAPCSDRVRAEHAVADVAQACRTATDGAARRCCSACRWTCRPQPAPRPSSSTYRRRAEPAAPDVRARWSAALAPARRPVFIAGRGATRHGAARAALAELAGRCGALLAVSAAAKGLFVGDPWYLDVSGGFATPLAAELIAQADLVVAWGSTLNMWTTRHGRLIAPDAVIAQVDVDPTALGRNRTVHIGVAGDVDRGRPRLPGRRWPDGPSRPRWRTPRAAGPDRHARAVARCAVRGSR